MMALNYQEFIERNPGICGGEPVIRGTRVTVRTILASLAEGADTEEIVADFPTVSPQAIKAIVKCAQMSEGRISRALGTTWEMQQGKAK